MNKPIILTLILCMTAIWIANTQITWKVDVTHHFDPWNSLKIDHR